MVFNANDPSGTGGLSTDVTAMSSASTHVLPVVTGSYVRDTTELHDHIAFDEEAVSNQARIALEDIAVHAFKVGFVGTPANLSVIAGVASDYPDIPLVAYMPDLSWMDRADIDTYLDAFAELLLPQTTVLVGNHNTLCRWLLPEWENNRAPTPRDVARAAAIHGASYILVTGLGASDQHLENHLVSPETLLTTTRCERIQASFGGAGETLSAALTALLACGADLQTACVQAVTYLDQCLGAGFQPGMGRAVPDRLFWAHDDDDLNSPADTENEVVDTAAQAGDFPLNSTQH